MIKLYLLSLIFNLVFLYFAVALNLHAQSEIQLTSDFPQEFESFGLNISANGGCEFILIGGPLRDTTNGVVYVFQNQNNSWILDETLLSENEKSHFGFSVSLDNTNTYAVIGAPATGSGSVFIYHNNGTNWSRIKKISGEFGSRFGWNLATSDSANVIVIGAPSEENNGRAYFFEKVDTGWVQKDKVLPNDLLYVPHFPTSIDINSQGNRAILGSVSGPGNENLTGTAYVYEKTDTNWILKEKIFSSDGQLGDDFGLDVSINSYGDRIAVGSSLSNANGGYSGSVYIYDLIDESWIETKIVADDTGISDLFGKDLQLSKSGDTLIVTSFLNGSVGSAYQFIFQNSNWVQNKKFTTSDASLFDGFGIKSSYCENGDIAIISSYLDDVNGLTDAGSVYVFKLDQITSTGTISNNNFERPFRIFPNPFNDQLNISFQNDFPEFLQIINCSGIVIQEIRSISNDTQINLNDSPSGVYFVDFILDNVRYVEKIVKMP